MDKDFRKDLQKFEKMLRDKVPFAFSKFADGEWAIIDSTYIDLLDKYNGEFKYDPEDSKYHNPRHRLIDSFTNVAENYFVGIACPCCVGSKTFDAMKIQSGQPESALTWANLWVNNNYQFYMRNIIKLYRQYDVILVCHEKADISGLPFDVDETFRVDKDAWLDSNCIVEKLKDKHANSSGKLFLFAAGPFGNILASELFKHNNLNTYLDIGSTLDFLMSLGKTRGYLAGANTLNKVCIWE